MTVIKFAPDLLLVASIEQGNISLFSFDVTYHLHSAAHNLNSPSFGLCRSREKA